MDFEADLVREARIDKYGVLGGVLARDLQALLDLTAQVCDVPAAAINLISSTHQHQVAAFGFEASVCAREDSMCASVLEQPTLTVFDASQDGRFARNPFVNGEIGAVRFYATSPSSLPTG